MTPEHDSGPDVLPATDFQRDDSSVDRRTLEELRANEERYRALVEASTLMVWHTDADGMVDDMPVWREITGQSAEEVRGLGWTRAIHPDDAPQTSEIWKRAVETRSAYESQYRLQQKDGSYRWYRARGLPIVGGDGRVREWIGVFNDIDRSVRREEGMRFLAEASATLTESLDERATLDALARLAVDYLADGCMITLPGRRGGWDHVSTRSRDGDVTAAFVAETERLYPLPPDAPSGYPRAIRTGEAELVPEHAFEDRVLPSVAVDATHLERLRRLEMYSAMVIPLVARGGTLGAITLVLHGPARRRPFDTGDLALGLELGRRAALALDNARLFAAERAARAEAESANRAKSDLLAKVSHETRQPVHATVGWIDTLDLEIFGPLTDAQRDALRRIKQNQSRLLAVLNDLLDMSRIEAGKLDLHLAPVPLAQVIDAVESAIRPQMQERGIDYDFCRPPDDLVVYADRDQLVGILTNLLSNAAKFTPPGGQVSVDCHREDERVVVAVCDTGIGIAPELHERVFEPFFQVESGFTRTTVGTGLGLAISREAARAMGGELTLTSTLGVGSIFSVRLPAAHTSP